MNWTVVKITKNGGNKIPFVSIGNGRLEFNAVACELINERGQYQYAQLLTGTDESGNTVNAVRFLESNEEETIKITRKVQKGKPIRGMTVSHKSAIQNTFGQKVVKQGTKRYGVKKVDNNTLMIIE